MKILLTGGGTGGHFYPIISVVENLRRISKTLKLLDPEIYYMAPEPYDEKALFDNDIIFKRNTAGKRRLYFSLWNFIDLFKIAWGILTATLHLFFIFPDVIFSKGGYVSFPVLFAARIFQIPVVIHESDSVPGRVNIWAGKFAQRIAISFPEAASFFPEGKVALTGNPVRRELITPAKEGAREYLNLESDTPVILILGGSQGAQVINDVILRILPKLVEKYQIIHQTGPKNINYIKETSGVILHKNKLISRYKVFPWLNILALKMSAGISNLVISRSGSSIFEIALWGLPSILIPIPESISHDQRSNAFAYATSGGAVVIEEKNLSPNVLLSEIDRILSDKELQKSMSKGALSFAQGDAGEKIAREILNIALEHEN